MKTSSQRILLLPILTAVVLAASWPASAAAGRRRSLSEPAAKGSQQVELFAGMESGEIKVDFIPSDATSANVIFQNKTGKPLAIKLPAAFAGVPVQAQFGGGMGGMGGGMGGMGGGMGGMGGGMGGGQGMGGGMGGMGGGMGGMGGGMGGMGGGGGGGGFFNVAPEQKRKLKVPCLCLEHGKPDPTPRMAYKIVPLELLNDNPAVAEVCMMLGRGEVPHNAAQAAAWHLTDRLSWAELAVKNRVELRTVNYFERRFRPAELAMAYQITAVAGQRARVGAARRSLRDQSYSPGQTATGGASAARSQQRQGARGGR